MSQEPQKKTDAAPSSHPALAWVLVGVLAVIALASFAFDDQKQQSGLIIAALILGLIGILVVSVRAGRNKQS